MGNHRFQDGRRLDWRAGQMPVSTCSTRHAIYFAVALAQHWWSRFRPPRWEGTPMMEVARPMGRSDRRELPRRLSRQTQTGPSGKHPTARGTRAMILRRVISHFKKQDGPRRARFPDRRCRRVLWYCSFQNWNEGPPSTSNPRCLPERLTADLLRKHGIQFLSAIMTTSLTHANKAARNASKTKALASDESLLISAYRATIHEAFPAPRDRMTS